MHDHKFDENKFQKLNDPKRLELQPPALLWQHWGLPGVTVIGDIGAGTGFFAKAFLGLAPAARVVALDVSDFMLSWMAEHLPEVAAGKIIPTKMQESSTPLADQSLDLACMLNLHHELHSPQDLLQDCLRILKPGGRLLISDWLPLPMDMGPPLAIRLAPELIATQMQEAGFAPVQVHPGLACHCLVVGQKP